jgi:mannose/fructose/N-acetylgalactosamine-specific phosphotransferase system component IIC
MQMGLPDRQETIEGYSMGNMDTRSIVIFLVIGLVAGFLAGLVVGGGNILMYLVWGILGSCFRPSRSTSASAIRSSRRSSPRPWVRSSWCWWRG